MDSALAVIQAVIVTLSEDTAVAALVADRIYTDVPQRADFPYVVLRIDSAPFAARDFSGQSHTLRIQCFSQLPTISEALDVRKACMEALDRKEADIAVSGFSLIRSEFSGGGITFKEDDGKTWQAVGEIQMDVA